MVARRELLRGLFVAALLAGSTGITAGGAFAAPIHPAPAGKKPAHAEKKPVSPAKDHPRGKAEPRDRSPNAHSPKPAPKPQPGPAAKPRGNPGKPGRRPD